MRSGNQALASALEPISLPLNYHFGGLVFLFPVQSPLFSCTSRFSSSSSTTNSLRSLFYYFSPSAGPSQTSHLFRSPLSFAFLDNKPTPMAAVNMHMMPTGMSLDFLPQHPSHSRSNSVSSSSTHSSHSRPQSSQGGYRMQPGAAPSAEDLYRASYHLGHQNLMQPGEVRFMHCYTSSFLVFLIVLLIARISLRITISQTLL